MRLPWLPTDTELQEDEYERAEPEPESAVLDVRYAPPRTSWTTAPPTQPGLYAVRVPGGQRRVVEVYRDRRGRFMASWTDVNPFPVDVGGGIEFSDRPYLDPS